MQLNFRPTAKILTLMLCLLALASCKGQQVQTFSPQELAAARTKLAYQQQTQQVSQLKTQGLWTDGPQAQAELPPTSLPPAQTESTQMPGIPTATSALQSEQTQVVSTNTRQPTRPVILPSTASPTRTQVSAAVTPTATRTRTPLPANTATQQVQTGWAGEWIIYMEQVDGSYQTGLMNVTVNGTDISANAIVGSSQYQFEGIIYAEDEQASGPYQSESATGYYWWLLVSEGQFGGMFDQQFGFCGARAGVEMPDPCYLEPPR